MKPFTPKLTQPSLCESCSWSTIVRGKQMHEELRHCSEIGMGRPITFDVVECSSYRNKNETSLRHMEQVAWRICADKKGRSAGFLKPDEFKAAAKEGTIKLTDHDEERGYGG